MKRNTVVLIVASIISLALGSCSSLSDLAYTHGHWGELEEDQTYIYRGDSLNAIVDYEMNTGSVLLFGKTKGDFQEVFIYNSSRSSSKSKRVTYYAYKPKYKDRGSYSSSKYERYSSPPVDLNRTYYTGPRGGCYYVNSNGNQVYVDHSNCDGSYASYNYNSSSSKSSKSSRSGSSYKGSSGGDVHVKGHYRTTKSGKTVYVKPHTRSRN